MYKMNYFFKRADERVDRFGSASTKGATAFLRERFGASISTDSSPSGLVSLVRFAAF